ncbi:hypothetical protein SDC9_115154 [bioreactor metagenome]|uniref:Glycosyltransferase subfamily 4-like N-terminal domain-containing protein n=1 Tax=bioreactor metagenome TaxID=1076179 RepID=A0A645BYM9_9ZZZZ
MKGLPLQVGYFYNNKAKKQLLELVNRSTPDRIYCQLLRTAEYGKMFNIRKMIDYQDVFSQGMLRRAEKSNFLFKKIFMTEYYRLQRYERNLFSWFDHKIIISKYDRDYIAHPQKEEITIIPNGVDHDFFRPQLSEKKYDLVFTGNMNYPPNISAAEYIVYQILPIVQKVLPNTTALISGVTPHARVRALQGHNVTVTGWVEDIRTSYSSAKIFIAPMLIGTGLQNKLLEAMAMKLPCISSKLANKSLCAKPNDEIITCQTPQEYADAVVYLLQNQEDADKLADNGHRFVKQQYNWELTVETMEQVMGIL